MDRKELQRLVDEFFRLLLIYAKNKDGPGTSEVAQCAKTEIDTIIEKLSCSKITLRLEEPQNDEIHVFSNDIIVAKLYGSKIKENVWIWIVKTIKKTVHVDL